jgi:hypothetical protein
MLPAPEYSLPQASVTIIPHIGQNGDRHPVNPLDYRKHRSPALPARAVHPEEAGSIWLRYIPWEKAARIYAHGRAVAVGR